MVGTDLKKSWREWKKKFLRNSWKVIQLIKQMNKNTRDHLKSNK